MAGEGATDKSVVGKRKTQGRNICTGATSADYAIEGKMAILSNVAFLTFNYFGLQIYRVWIRVTVKI